MKKDKWVYDTVNGELQAIRLIEGGVDLEVRALNWYEKLLHFLKII